MKVLIVVDGLGTGGAERSLAEMLPRYAHRGVDATVVCFYHRSEGVEGDVVGDGHDVRFVETRHLLGRARAIRNLVVDEGFDLIHTQLFEADLAGRLAAIGSNVPVLTSLVNTSYVAARLSDPNIARLKLEAVRRIDGWTGRMLTDHYHAISGAVKDASVAALSLNPDRITIVGRGRDPARLGQPSPDRRARARRQLGLKPEVPILVAVGRQEYQKGHAHLLQAMPAILTRRPDAVLLLAGREGHASPELHSIHRTLRLDESVRLLGHRADVPELLAAADVFVFPSLFEGLGGAVIEAMGLGLPIVASDIAAMRGVLLPGENSLLVPPENPLALAEAIEIVLNDEDLRRRYSERSLQRFEERFTIDSVVDRMVHLYARVIAEKRGPATTS